MIEGQTGTTLGSTCNLVHASDRGA